MSSSSKIIIRIIGVVIVFIVIEVQVVLISISSKWSCSDNSGSSSSTQNLDNNEKSRIILNKDRKQEWSLEQHGKQDHSDTSNKKKSSSSSWYTSNIDNTIESYFSLYNEEDIPSTIFPKWDYNKNPFPCEPGEKGWYAKEVGRSPSHDGLLFVRNMKTGSSTTAGIALRIARKMFRQNKELWTAYNDKTNNATYMVGPPMCKVRYDHNTAKSYEYDKRNKDKSFLFSFVRHPIKRTISEFFHFEVSRNRIQPTNKAILDWITSKTYLYNYFLFDMSLELDYANFTRAKEAIMMFRNYASNETKTNIIRIVDNILKEYNFIGLTERMDESLVVLKHILNLDMNDILYLSAKSSGGFDEGGAPGKGCTYIIPSFVSTGMKDFFINKKEWKIRSMGDNLLYKAIDISLDKTIRHIGVDVINKDVVKFRNMLQKANDQCLSNTIFPCSDGGDFQLQKPIGHPTKNDCLWWDCACGYKCLDTIR